MVDGSKRGLGRVGTTEMGFVISGRISVTRGLFSDSMMG
jgi:hypothetical protein